MTHARTSEVARRRLLAAALGLIALSVAVNPARACSAHVEGTDGARVEAHDDETRWSFGTTVDGWRDAFGVGQDRQRLETLRLSVAGAARVAGRWRLRLGVPVSWRKLSMDRTGDEIARAASIGDVETGVSHHPGDAALAPWWGAAIRWPTGPELRTGGALVPDDAQPGTGAVVAVASAGLQRRWTAGHQLSPELAGAASGFVPVAHLRDTAPGPGASLDLIPSLGFSWGVRVELGLWLRGNLGARGAAHAHSAAKHATDDESGANEVHAAALTFGLTPGLAVAPSPSITVAVRGLLPVAELSPDHHRRRAGGALTVRFTPARGAAPRTAGRRPSARARASQAGASTSAPCPPEG